jgi:SnoaL-like protein
MEQVQALQRAEDVEDRTRELYAAIERGDSSFPADFIAHGDESLVIGTDPGEWWSGYEQIVGTWSKQIKETAGVTFEDSGLRAYASGDVAWVADQPTVKLPDGNSVTLRLTGVYRREDGVWKLAQWHASIGLANEEVLGGELTT